MKKKTQLLLDNTNFSISGSTNSAGLVTSLRCLFPSFSPEDILFFDIETTGLSAEISSLYLIGACHYLPEKDCFELIQLFAEEFDDEIQLLCEFSEIFHAHKLFLHYNGLSFDLPYLNEKCRQFSLPFRFEPPEQLDIYQCFHRDKICFTNTRFPWLGNKKQSTMERFTGFVRRDQKSGKELIQTYGDYRQAHIKKQQEETEYLSLLLLHNHDDLCGLLSLLPLLGVLDLSRGEAPWFSLKECHFKISTSKETLCSLELVLQTSFPLPANILPELPGGSLKQTASGWQLHVTIHGFYGNLKYFFKDYKNYYYLPDEDIAIHKSVAQFIDKNRRMKATSKNCYQKKEGWFFPLPEKTGHQTPVIADIPEYIFYQKYKQKPGFWEWTEQIAQQKTFLATYGMQMALD